MQQWTMAKVRWSRKKATGHNGGSLNLPTWPFARWTILHFPSLMDASEGILRTLANLPRVNWKIEAFCRAIGLDVRCSVWAEQSKIPVALGLMQGAYLSTETNLILICGVARNEFDIEQTCTGK